MKSKIIASRNLMIKSDSGDLTSFNISIYEPFAVDEIEYCCEIYSDDVIFKGIKKSFGVDSIDCIDYAIQIIDLLFAEFPRGKIFWPDGTLYVRVPTNQKMGWGKDGGNQ